LSATISLSQTHNAFRAASTKALQRYSYQAQSNRQRTETIDAIELARKAGYNSIISTAAAKPKTLYADLACHRRGPDQDAPLAHHVSPNTISFFASKRNLAPPQIPGRSIFS